MSDDDIAAHYTRKALSDAKGMDSRFDSVHVTVFPPGYEIRKFTVIETPGGSGAIDASWLRSRSRSAVASSVPSSAPGVLRPSQDSIDRAAPLFRDGSVVCSPAPIYVFTIPILAFTIFTFDAPTLGFHASPPFRRGEFR